MPVNQIIKRGLVAAHGALLGALFLFFLHAPAQVLGAVGQALQADAARTPGQAAGVKLVAILAVSFASLVCALAVFFLYPLLLGGILGQIRDRIESPRQPPGLFGTYGRAFYGRLLGNLCLFTLIGLVFLLPVMGIAIGLAYQKNAEAISEAAAWPGDTPPQTLDGQQPTRQLMSDPVLLAAMAIASVFLSVLSMVYWVANTVVVSDQEGVVASCRKSLRFCWQNVAAVLVVLLLSLAVGLVIAPLGLTIQLGVVNNPWALVALALAYAACISYWGVLLSGVIMSLYLARRAPPSSGVQSGLSAVA
jgi:hypothetical protein